MQSRCFNRYMRSFDNVPNFNANKCEYYHYPEFLSSALLSIDHIQPRSLSGSDDLSNFALACRRCNERRYNFTSGIDPETKAEVALFSPRVQQWSDHFIRSVDALQIINKTTAGRVRQP